jgi:hypothetical protein
MDVPLADLASGIGFLAATWLFYSSPFLVFFSILALWARHRRARRKVWLIAGAVAGLLLAPMPPPKGIIPLCPPALLAFPAGWVHPLNASWVAFSFVLSGTLGLLLGWLLSTRVPPNNSFKPNLLRSSKRVA